MPWSTTGEELIELFGCYDARLLKDDYGKSKGMAFCEFETEKASNEVYNNADGWEIGGRWLNLDKLRPKSEMGSSGKFSGKKNFGGKRDSGGNFRKSGNLTAAAKNKGYASGYSGCKVTFDD